MKKLMLLSLAIVCALAFSFTGCDDEGGNGEPTCAEECQASWVTCTAACEVPARTSDGTEPTCEETCTNTLTSCNISCSVE